MEFTMKEKIMLWGTGKQATYFMKNYYDILQNFFLLKGFIDSDKNNQGKLFSGYYVFPPETLKKYNIDTLVLMNKNENEIVEQIKNIFPSKIPFVLFRSKRDFFNYIVNQKKIFYQKIILFTGCYNGYATVAGRDQYISKISYYCKVKALKKQNLKTVDYFCICGKRYYDSTLNERFQNKIRRMLNEKFNIPTKKILNENQWRWFFDSDVLVRNNFSDELEKYLVIRVNDPYRGWGQILLNFLSAIHYAEKHNLHPVIDMQYSDNMYLAAMNKGEYNVWNDFFYPTSNRDVSDVLNNKCCLIYGSDLYLAEENMQFAKIRFLPHVFFELERRKNKLFSDDNKVLAVVYRDSDYRIAIDHPQPISVDEYIKKIDTLIEKYKFDTIFLATEVMEVVLAFKKYYGQKLRYSSQKRVKASEHNYLKNIFSVGGQENVYRNSIDYLAVIYILSKCNAICGSRCGASQLAVVMNDNKFWFVDYFYKMSIDCDL